MCACSACTAAGPQGVAGDDEDHKGLERVTGCLEGVVACGVVRLCVCIPVCVYVSKQGRATIARIQKGLLPPGLSCWPSEKVGNAPNLVELRTVNL